MAIHLSALVTSFLITFSLLPIIIKFFKRRNWMDTPGGRKIHKKITPSLGGIPIFIGFIVSSLVWVKFSDVSQLRYVLISLVLIFILGIRDDLVPFKARIKLLGQIMCVAIFLNADIRITTFNHLFGIGTIPTWISYALTGATLIFIINAFNLIDGLDGLAGIVGGASIVVAGVWFYYTGDMLFSLLCFSMLGGIIGFLVFNWEPSEIFMGDTGAMTIGLFLGMVAIRFMNHNIELSADEPYRFNALIAGGVALVIIPVWDTLRVIVVRIIKGTSPFTPDKRHLHHTIMRLGLSHARTTLLLFAIQAMVLLLVFLLREKSDGIVLSVVAVILLLIALFLDNSFKKIKKQNTENKTHQKQERET